MMKFKTFLMAAVTTLSFTVSGTAQEKTETGMTIEQVKRRLSFERGETAFKLSGESKLARLTVKVGDLEYDIRDGCLPYQGLGECKLDDKPDICAVYENRVIKENLFGVEKAEPVCGDIYRKTKEEFIDYHVNQIKKLLEAREGTVSFGKFGSGKGATVTDDKEVKYSVYDRDNDGTVETMILKTKDNPYFSKLFIDRNESPDIKKKIGGLYNYIEEYVMKNWEE